MKKRISILAAAAILLMSANAYAAAGGEKGPNQAKETHSAVEMKAADETKADTTTQTAATDEQEDLAGKAGKSDNAEKAEKGAHGKPENVTASTYGNGYRGLEHAYENVKDKPAGKVIAGLLQSHYGIDVTADVYLSQAADDLAAQGDVETAVDVQQEAVKLNVSELDNYKKLGKLLEKLGKSGVKAYVNGEEPNFEVAPFIKDGSTLVPFRAISEALKADVQWNPDEQSVTVSRDGTTIKLIIGSTTAYVDGKEVTLEVPGEIDNGSTMVPVRFISESLKAVVKWEPESQSAVIYEEQPTDSEQTEQTQQ